MYHSFLIHSSADGYTVKKKKKMIRSRHSKGRTRRVQQCQPTTQACPTLTWMQSAPSSQRQGHPPICLSLSLGSQEANLWLCPRGKFPAAPTAPVAVIPGSRQRKPLPCLGKGKDHQLRAASVTKLGSTSCFKVTTATHNCLIAHICLTPRLSSLLVR